MMPVVTVDDPDSGVALARALASGGLGAIEVTLRTPAAMAAIRAIRSTVPDLLVGAGTVVTPALMGQVSDAGGQFAVSPGFSPALDAAARECSLPYLPGVVTASEVQAATEQGLKDLKFFPAQAVGGASLLRNYAAVFPDVRFCPTGGVNEDNMSDYLQLANVVCVGGSWLAPRELIRAGDWEAISALAAGAARFSE